MFLKYIHFLFHNFFILFIFLTGEEPFSYGYGGTAKKSLNSKFENYGETFGENDVIGCFIVRVYIPIDLIIWLLSVGKV